MLETQPATPVKVGSSSGCVTGRMAGRAASLAFNSNPFVIVALVL